jgi:dihydrodipicolinate synthase/N-acetylneuraminate lyase
MDVSPRRRDIPDAVALDRLLKAAGAKTDADAELKAAVRAAKAAGGSVRVIAEFAHLSTRTVQDWVKSAN